MANGPAPLVSLLNQSALNTVGGYLDLGTCQPNHTLVVTSGAAVSAGAVQLQGSLDATNWFNLGAAVTTNAASTTFTPIVVTNQPVRFLRATITTGITGGTISAVVAAA